MAEISKMAEDLAKALDDHRRTSVKGVGDVSQKMVDAANSMTAPAHGVSVTATRTTKDNGYGVDVTVRPMPGAVGQVFGGAPAARAAVRRRLDSIAAEAGLD